MTEAGPTASQASVRSVRRFLRDALERRNTMTTDPVGTPTFAMVDGVVVAADGSQPVYRDGLSRCGNIVAIQGVDQVKYTYCHLSQVVVASGDHVVAGQLIGATGGQPGSRGAGNTTGPHLHLGMRGQGRSLCPQGLLRSILDGAPVNPLTLPSSGCIS